MKIYTGFGDSGNTALFGGQVVRKNHIRVEAYGSIDELNSMIGLLRAKVSHEQINELLKRIQSELFVLSSEIAGLDEDARSRLEDSIQQKHARQLEQDIDRLSDTLPSLKSFILPAGNESAALCHVTRTVCRRAERALTALSDAESNRQELLIYMNRLGDLFFVLARVLNQLGNMEDEIWKGLKKA